MRSASRRLTGDDTVRNTSAHAVPPAELRITKARTRTESNRCCWTQCQTNTTRWYPGAVTAAASAQAGSGTQLPWKPAGTRWGSAKSDGSIRLHWRLVHFRPEVIDYVVAHELSHLRVMDHSPRFWDTVRSVVPDYAELRGQLKDEAIPKW